MLIDDYVTELDRALSGPSGPKRDLVVEARDSLADTADAFEAEGLDRAAAEQLAVAEFGRIREIAPGYQAELTAVAGRRLGRLLFVSVPVTVLMWSAIWRFQPGGVDAHAAWAARPSWFAFVSHALDLVQLATGLYGGLALLALSRAARWISGPRLVTRSLGMIVWVVLPVTAALGLLLSQDSMLPAGFAPAALANLVTYAFAGLQLYGATRCLRLTRRA